MNNLSPAVPSQAETISPEAVADRKTALLVLQSFDHCDSNDASAQRLLDQFEMVRQQKETPPSLLDMARLYCEYVLLSQKDPMQCVTAWLDAPKVITIPNIFIISKSEAAERIGQYLDELADIASTEKRRLGEESPVLAALKLDRFLTRVEITAGFVAPMFLIDGLMAKFDENWGEVIQGFENTLRCGIKGADIQQFRQMQLFTFDCWLLWGPSIRVCLCDSWCTRRPADFDPLKHLPAYGRQEAISALQYGFGDENNSIPLINVSNESQGELMSFEVLRNNALVASRAPATRHKLTARIIASSAAQGHICHVQQDLPPFLLDYIHAEDGSGAGSTAVDYYSAYLWAMFVLCKRDQAGRFVPCFDGSAGMMPWQGMVPVFVHGNIADPQTYSVSKAQLAYKALGTLNECLSGNSLMGQQCPIPNDMCFVYTCASDDSGGCCPDLARDGGFEDHHEFSIAGLLNRLMEQGEAFADIQKRVLHYSALADDNLRSLYSACHLPELINNFYRDIEAAASQAPSDTVTHGDE